MAFIDQKMKSVISAALKQCMPSDWKYSLAVRHHAEIVMTIMSAPADIIGELDSVAQATAQRRGYPFSPIRDGNVQLGDSSTGIKDQFPPDSKIYAVLEHALVALQSAGWYDNSDVQRDHVDIAYYYRIDIGRWNKPFRNTLPCAS